MKESNMIVVVTWICCCIAFPWASVLPQKASYNSVSFGTTFSEASVGFYQTFIQSLRRELSSGTESHGIPVLRTKSTAVEEKQFVYVRLHNANAVITFAIKALDLYVVAYQVDAEKRCYFFEEAPAKSKTLLFNQCTRKVDVKEPTNYVKLGDRTKTKLGFKQLDQSLGAFIRFDSENPTDELRQNLLVVIQMVAEAARFKYIQQKIEREGFLSGFLPKGDIISYENNWENLSTAIQVSGDGNFTYNITLTDENYSTRNVSNVTAVKDDIGLLLYVAGGMVSEKRFKQKIATTGDLIPDEYLLPKDEL